MNYKTIVLRLLEEHPKTYARLSLEQAVLPTIESQARLLKARHEELIELFSLTNTQQSPVLVSEAAMEMAVSELEQSFENDSLPPSIGPLSLDAAMDYIRRHSSPA